MLAAMALSVVTSLLLPLFESEYALMAIYRPGGPRGGGIHNERALACGRCRAGRQSRARLCLVLDRATALSTATFADIKGDGSVWAGWIVSASGLLVQGVIFPFFPLLANAQGLGPVTIGVVFLVLGLANTAARLPAGWLIDRTGRLSLYVVGGVIVASLATALLPHVRDQTTLLVLIGIFGVPVVSRSLPSASA